MLDPYATRDGVFFKSKPSEYDRRKAEYMNRPGDINLGPIWNSMRAKQREISWREHEMYSLGQQSNLLPSNLLSAAYQQQGYGHSQLFSGIFGGQR